MVPPPDDPLEELLAAALAAFDEQGEVGLQQFLADHTAHRPALERGLDRCRQMGLLGQGPVARDFPDRLGEFRLLRRLGSGGMGVVYEAEQESLGRRVAIKVVRPELLYFEGARERFRREIEAIARLSHPAIVPVLASGEQDGLPWYAMELLDGRSVHELCAALHGRDPALLRGEDLRAAVEATPGTATDPFAGAWWQSCARIVHAIALGVRHAHLRGIVHRDIKPSNVMLTRDGRMVLLDFGIARVTGDREFTRTGNTPGSPAFMSPEQLRGDAVDERTDVYSLAATLWQMLTLAPPFAGIDALERLRDGNAPPVRSRNREVPPELDLVVRKAMDGDRERRYADVGAFADDLQAVLQRRPIRARRLGLPLRTWRWCQRHRVSATALAAVLVAGLLLPAVLAWRERTINRELERAVGAAQDSLTTTLDTIQALLVQVGEDRLRHVPAAEAVARGVLGDACAMYEQLLARHPDHARLRGNAADAISRYAHVLARGGDTDGARTHLLRGVDSLGGDDLGVARGLLLKRALLRIHLGGLAGAASDPEAAEAHFATAERDLDAARQDAALRIDGDRMRIDLLNRRAALLDPWREPERKEQLSTAAVALARSVHRQKPDNPSDARQLVDALDLLATLWSKQGRADEALQLLEEALTIARAIPANAVLWPPQPQLVAAVLLTMGNLHLARRDGRAVPVLKECLQLREQAVRDHPGDVLLRSDLASVLHGLANLSFLQANDDLALQRIDRAIALQRDVLAAMPGLRQGREHLVKHLTLRGSVLAKLGRAADLHEVTAELTATDHDPAAQRAAARLWLRLGGLAAHTTPPPDPLPTPAQCQDRALACLLAAERLGWGPGQAFGDAVYDPLRPRPEFRALVARRTAAPAAGADDGDQAEVSPSSTSSASREMPR